MLALVGTAYLTTAPSVQVAAQPSPDLENWKIEKIDETRALDGRTVVEISNPSGDVRCRAIEGDQVEVAAVVQHHSEDLVSARVTVESADDRLRIGVEFDRPAEPVRETEAMKRRRVDLTIFIPQGVEVSIETDRGLIEARGLSSGLEARSQTGDIKFRTNGSVQAETRSGNIEVNFSQVSWETPSKLETTTGNLTLWIPRSSDLTIAAETRGEISTDFSIDIERPDDTKRATARLGAGSHRLEVISYRGKIGLYERPS
jgi:hypothetical protein